MTKLLLIMGVIIGGLVTSFTLPVRATASDTQQLPSRGMPSSYIDGIEVPYEVLESIHDQHQGYAVTKASKILGDDEQVFRLRADRDTQGEEESIYFFYNEKWQPLGSEAQSKPIEKLSPQPIQTKTPPPNEPQPESSSVVDGPTLNEGGRGDNPEPEITEQPQLVPPPAEETTPISSPETPNPSTPAEDTSD